MVNQHRNVIHQHIPEKIISEILLAQKWQPTIGHYRISLQRNVFFVFGKENNISFQSIVFEFFIDIRYNISTTDYDGWNTSASSNGNNLLIMPEYEQGMTEWMNWISSDWYRYFANNSIAVSRGYRFRNDPNVQIFEGMDMPLQLAVNTAQYSRVFEDRFERWVTTIDCLIIENLDHIYLKFVNETRNLRIEKFTI